MQSDPLTAALLAILEGSSHASAWMAHWSRPAPGPIRLPDDDAQRAALVAAHVSGAPGRVLYSKDKLYKPVDVAAVQLFARCPGADGLVRWLAFDLDAADGHGARGLVDPPQAARYFAAAADDCGLLTGMFVARSRGGRGRHVWLLTPGPVALVEAVIVAAALAARAIALARDDAPDGRAPFRRADGSIARPGDSGAIDLFPHSDQRPPAGWQLALPAAGALASVGGGVIVDPFSDVPTKLLTVPSAASTAWTAVVNRHRRALQSPRSNFAPHRQRSWQSADPLERAHPRTLQLLDGHAPEGERNKATFAGACNLLSLGLDPSEVRRLVVSGAVASGLPEREAIAAANSALRRKGVRP